MKKKGLWLIFIGLVLGISCTFLALEWGKSELVKLINEQLEDGCQGTLDYDSIKFSFLPLRSTLKNARILVGDDAPVKFREVSAKVSLPALLNKQIILSLFFKDGAIDGFDEESALFQFIDYLTRPSDPDRQASWKVVLKRLEIEDSQIFEQFTDGKLQAKGVSVKVLLDENGDYAIPALISSLAWLNSDEERGKPLIIGSLDTKVVIKDNSIDFDWVKLTRGDALVSLQAVSDLEKNYSLSGEVELAVDSTSLELPAFFKNKLIGSGTLSGTLTNPKASIAFHAPAGTETSVSIEETKYISFNDLKGNLEFDLNQGSPRIEINKLKAAGEKQQLSLIKPVVYSNGEMTGQVSFIAADGDSLGIPLSGLLADIEFQGALTDPTIQVNTKIEELGPEALRVGPAKIDLAIASKVLDFKIHSQGKAQGLLMAQGHIRPDDKNEYILEEGSFEIDSFPLYQEDAEPADNQEPTNIFLKASGSVHGPLSLDQLNAKATLNINTESFPVPQLLKGEVILDQGALRATLIDDLGKATAEIRTKLADLQHSSFHIEFNDFSPQRYSKRMRCDSVTGSADYNFSFNSPLTGSGEVILKTAELGYAKKQLSLKNPVRLPINQGNLSFKNFTLSGKSRSMNIAGSISFAGAVDLDIGGDFDAQIILPLVPQVDDIEGTISTVFRINRTPSDFSLFGKADIQNGAVSIESAGIDGTEIAGSITVDKKSIEIKNISGLINNGRFDLEGLLDLEELKRSNAILRFNQLEFFPTSNVEAVFSGKIELKQGPAESAVVSGKIEVDQGEFQQTLSNAEFVRELVRKLLSKSDVHAIERPTTASRTEQIEFDLDIYAERNLLITTNWGSAELKADFRLEGTLANPVLSGSAESLGGWFAIKNKRFSIIRGKMNLKPGSADPVLDLQAESSLRAPDGDIVRVFVGIVGPASDPELRLTSDGTHSHSELLTLIAASHQIGEAEEEAIVPIGLIGGTKEERESRSFFDWIRWGIRRITRLDTLTIEPHYNEETGRIDSKMIAGKRLGSQSEVRIGQFMGSRSSESDLTLDYNWNERTVIRGKATSDTAQKQDSLAAEIGYIVKSDRMDHLVLRLRGNKELSRSKILRELKIGSRAGMAVEDLPTLAEEARQVYRESAFSAPEIYLHCEDEKDICWHVRMNIEEGPRTIISEVTFKGDSLPDLPEDFEKLEKFRGAPSTEGKLRDARYTLLRILREKDFHEARVIASFEETALPNERILVLQVRLGNKILFDFTGNENISSEDLLETANLMKREQPFGRNTIILMLEQIKAKYVYQGFRDIVAEYQTETSQDLGTLTYNVEITEGPRTEVNQVTFQGNASIPTSKLRALIEDRDEEVAERMFDPKYAIDEELDYQAELLSAVYRRQGYLDTSVSYKTEKKQDNKIDIIYTISEGEGFFVKVLSFSGLPPDLKPPKVPKKPLPLSDANQTITAFYREVQNGGYPQAEIATEWDSASGMLKVIVTPNKPTRIGAVIVKGISDTREEAVREIVALKPGDIWDAKAVMETKDRLLRLNLYSRVEIQPADGDLNEELEDLVITVTERTLQSLTVGAGYDTENDIRLFLEGTDRSFFLDGRELTLRLDGYYNPTESIVSKGLASFRYTDPYVFGSNYRLTEDLRFTKLRNANLPYDTDRATLVSYIDHRWPESKIESTFGHTFSFENLSSVQPDAVLSELDTDNLHLSYLSGSAIWNRYDDVLTPGKGYKVSIESKIASNVLASEASFFRVGGNFAFLFPLSRRTPFTFANNSAAAALWPFGDTDEIPITQRIFLGGANSVRGFRENSLGPKGEAGSPTGGDFGLFNNMELRYRFFENLSTHLLYDLGTVYLQDQGIDWDDLRHSAGVGARFITPVGPIGFDLAFPLDQHEGEASVRFHFRIGAMF